MSKCQQCESEAEGTSRFCKPCQTCACCTCGFEWPRGADGSHYCADILRRMLHERDAQLIGMIAKLEMKQEMEVPKQTTKDGIMSDSKENECNCADWGSMDHTSDCPASWKNAQVKKTTKDGIMGVLVEYDGTRDLLHNGDFPNNWMIDLACFTRLEHISRDMGKDGENARALLKVVQRLLDL